jgi:hypothetical protein
MNSTSGENESPQTLRGHWKACIVVKINGKAVGRDAAIQRYNGTALVLRNGCKWVHIVTASFGMDAGNFVPSVLSVASTH